MLQETPDSPQNLSRHESMQDVNDGQNQGFREDPPVPGHVRMEREGIQRSTPDSQRDDEPNSYRGYYPSPSTRQSADTTLPPSVPGAVSPPNIHYDSPSVQNADPSIDHPNIYTPSTATLPPDTFSSPRPALNVTDYGMPLPGIPVMPQSNPLHYQMWSSRSFAEPQPQPQPQPLPNIAQFHSGLQPPLGPAYGSLPPMITPQSFLPPTFYHNTATPSYPQPANFPTSADIVATATSMPPQSSSTRPIPRSRHRSRGSSSGPDPYSRHRSRNESSTPDLYSRRSFTATPMPSQDYTGSSNIRPTTPQARQPAYYSPPLPPPGSIPYIPDRPGSRHRSNSSRVILTAMNNALPGESQSNPGPRRGSLAPTGRRVTDELDMQRHQPPGVDDYVDYGGRSYGRWDDSRYRWGAEADRRPRSPGLFQSPVGDYIDYEGRPYDKWGHSRHRWGPEADRRPRYPGLYRAPVYNPQSGYYTIPRPSYSPFRYARPPPPDYPEYFARIKPDQGFHYFPYKGFWSRIGTFFKLPFQRGQLQSLKTPYPTEKHDGILLLLFLEVVFSQIYFHVLLRLPSLYFSRVKRFFDETNLNLFEITEMAFETAEPSATRNAHSQGAMGVQGYKEDAHTIRPQYERLKNSWETFIDALVREWDTLNIVSVLLLSAILTILQISTAASDPVTRYAALFSLICALLSLIFGCMFIIRFGTMRKTYAAAEWAKTAIRGSTPIWNVWVLLSMPVVWLIWSIILFIVAIMSFVWRTTADNDNPSSLILSPKAVLILRIVMSSILILGLIHGILMTNTFRNYGEVLDKDWDEMISDYQEAKQEEGWGTRYAEFVRSGNIPLQSLGFSEPMYPRSMVAPPFDSRVKAGPMQSYSNPAIPGPMPTTIVQWNDTSTSSYSSDSAPLSPKPPRSILRNRRSATNRSRSPRRAHQRANGTYGKNNARSSKQNSASKPERAAALIPPLLSPIPSRSEAPSEILSTYDSPASSLHETGHNDSDQRRARFRVPLISVQDSASVAGSIGPGDEGVEMIYRPRASSQSHTQPLTSLASGVTPEMANVQSDDVALRQRRRPIHVDLENE